jgi:hypothetical protein
LDETNMAATTRRSKSMTIQPTIVTTASSFLEDLPAKPKENFSLREAVDQLRDPLKTALSKGYSYQDLASMLHEQGIEISASTLKNYVPSGKRQVSKTKAAATKSTGRGKRSTAAKTSETMSKIASADETVSAVVEVVPEALPEAPKTRGRRAASKVAAAPAPEPTPKAKAPRGTRTTTKAPTTRGRRKAV